MATDRLVRDRRDRKRRVLLAAFAGSVVSAGLPRAVAAADDRYPARAVTLVLPFAPGSVTDTATRLLAASLSDRLGQPFVVENRAGASGMIGANDVARAKADGYRLLFTTNTTQSVIRSLFRNVPYDPQADFTPIARVAVLPSMLVVDPRLPIDDIRSLTAYGQAHPDGLRFGYGNSSSQIGAETLRRRLGLTLQGVPYKANLQAAQDIVGGNLQLMVIDVSTGLPLVQSGRLRALVTMADRRTAALPNVPTAREAIAPDFDDLTAWLGVFGPARLPSSIADTIAGALEQALAEPTVASRLEAQSVVPAFDGTAHFRSFTLLEQTRWTRLAEEAGITPQ